MSDFYKTIDRKRWAVLRRKVFERDGYRCVDCHHSGRLECDHIVPRAKGGEKYLLSNLATRCRNCHIAKTQKENQKEPSTWQKFVIGMLLRP